MVHGQIRIKEDTNVPIRSLKTLTNSWNPRIQSESCENKDFMIQLQRINLK